MMKLENVENFCFLNAVWLLPLLILLLQFLLKFLISEKSKFQKFWESLLQSPVDIGFLSVSLFAGSIILNPTTGKFLMFIGLLVWAIIIVAIWKWTPMQLNGREIAIASGLMLLNFFLALLSLIVIINNM